MTSSMQYESVTCKSILNDVKAPSMPFEKSINPYRGCQHGCSFCYARSSHTFLGLEAGDTFQHHILLKSNAAEALEEQIAKKLRSRTGRAGIGRIAIGTATDPYQPVEGKMKLTRSCLEVLAKYQLPTSITTRSPLILRDIDLLKEIPVLSVNISVNTLNRQVWRTLEPSSPFPMKRLETVQRLNEEGIPSGIFMAPIIPYLTDSAQELSGLVEQAAVHKSRFVMSSFLRLRTSEVKVWFFQTLQQHYPHLVRPYSELFRDSGNTPSAYREPIYRQISGLMKKFGFEDKEPLNAMKSIQTPLSTDDSIPVQLSFTF